MYFNIESFIDGSTYIIFSERAGGVNLFKLNLNDGSMVEMTDYEGKMIKHVWHLPTHKEFYFEYDDFIRIYNNGSLWS